jgi:glycosyltransferase involved in cell wall biosynthesis
LLWPDRSRHARRRSTFDPILGVAQWSSTPRTDERPTRIESGSQPKNAGQGIARGDILVSVGLDWDHPYVDKFQHLSDAMGIKIVTCCYDLIPILLPQYCVGHVASKFRDYFTKLSWSSSLILCISQHSRNDYVEFAQKIGAPQADTLVIPLGDNVPKEANRRTVGDDVADDVSPDVLRVTETPFLLFVSTIERRKNHEVLYRAYHLLARGGHADRLPKLVFVGMPGWGVSDLLKDIELDPLTKGLVVQLNHVSDADLGYLYEKALFCVFPSLYEGWGLPVGEALACGKAVVASAQASIPEVGESLVTYLDPWNARAWADEILALVDNPERVRSMENAVRREYRVRTWRDTATVVKGALDRLREPADVAITLYPGYDLQTSTGTPCGEAIRSTGAPGSVTHGPYRTLPAGTYDIAITLDKLDGSGGRLACALRSPMGADDHAFQAIEFDEREHSDVVVTLQRIQLNVPINDYEICCEVTRDLLVSIKCIEINQVPA